MTANEEEALEDSDERKPRSRKVLLHFLWAEPLAIVLALVPLFYAAINMCGISGCSGGGFGVSPGDPREQFFAVLIAAIIVVTPVAAIPWSRKWVRFAVALGLCLALAVWFVPEFQPPSVWR